jgi:hypothetical protein
MFALILDCRWGKRRRREEKRRALAREACERARKREKEGGREGGLCGVLNICLGLFLRKIGRKMRGREERMFGRRMGWVGVRVCVLVHFVRHRYGGSGFN